MEHECLIGYLDRWGDGRFVTLEELKKNIRARKRLNDMVRSCKAPVYELSDYGDKRKSTDLCRYDYCPFCGKKIDWSAIKKMKVEEDIEP